MLKALIRKDLRLCRLPIVTGVVLLLGPFAMAVVIVSNMPLWTEATPASAWAVLLGIGSYFSVMCSQPTLAMISGNIIAAERSDRSAEFLAYLPPSRVQVLLSKFIVLAAAVVVVWGFHFGVSFIAYWLAGGVQAAETMTTDLVPLRYLAAIGFAAVGSGWCASAMSENTGPAVALAFATPLVLLGVLALTQYLTGWPYSLDYAKVYFSACAVCGAVLFMSGTVYFLRRIQP